MPFEVSPLPEDFPYTVFFDIGRFCNGDFYFFFRFIPDSSGFIDDYTVFFYFKVKVNLVADFKGRSALFNKGFQFFFYSFVFNVVEAPDWSPFFKVYFFQKTEVFPVFSMCPL